MAQVKKEAVRARILEAAARMFEEKGYVGSSMGQIAQRAHVSSANIYAYYPSKLDIVFAIFEPWIIERINQIELEARSIKNPKQRLTYVLARLWRDIPRERNNFFNNFIQAIAVSTSAEGYRPSILIAMRERIRGLVVDCLPEGRNQGVDTDAFTHLAVMAFDGFVINGHLTSDSTYIDRIVEATCMLLLGEGGEETSAKSTTKARAKS
ncbi:MULTISPECIES: TetR/AcrR family transcriptional regulator [unclassified Beijerinckia]|uniref:TetR/AcrR family transcriptional regulator n=1 Tax=unclassified Beijerinckia TaxID=2638183 RepID=UPI0008984CAA|nr:MULTISPECIES: TetR/AcrR family transcriptional regulator [unclassified Beijerinckia]MDH7796792.1 AcrR family transcriptional regulator [Beijerinckia sp. GAS462]SEC59996.1 transcriptional regulator, TetR family [Beijerinckia sp. 28-YEA-48]